MPPLPPLRTRQGVRTEPHMSQPRQDSTSNREPGFYARDAHPAPTPMVPPLPADDFPVLTDVIPTAEAPPEVATPVVGSPAVAPPAVDPQLEEDELVDRITAHVLAALRPGLEDLVADAVRSALQKGADQD